MVDRFGAVVARAVAAVATAKALPRLELAYRAAVVVSLLLGVVVRVIGQLVSVSSLWMDEAEWARRLIARSPFSFRFRPFGYMWAEKELVSVFGATEFWLRFLSFLAGLSTLFLMPYIGSRLLKGRLARLALVFLFALHPALIDLSKEFKPYAFEVLIHVVPVVLFLRYRQTLRPGFFYALLASVPLLFAFAYNLTFAWPGLLVLCLLVGRRELGKRGVLLAIGSGAACVAMLIVVYATMLRGLGSEKSENYWGKKYDVFYQPPRPPPAAGEDDDEDDSQAVEADAGSRVDWIVRKYADLVATPGLRREIWEPDRSVPRPLTRELASIDRWFWVLLHCVGIGALLLRRRYEDLLLLTLPLACAVACNAVGLWPFGAFRTNLFLCFYVLVIAAVGIDEFASGHTVRSLLLSVVLALTNVAPGFAFGFDWHAEKHIWTRNHRERELLETLRAERERDLKADPSSPPAPLLLDPQTFMSHDFYLDVHPETRAKHRAFFRKHFKQENFWKFPRRVQRELKSRLATGRPVFIVVSRRRDMDTVRNYAERVAEIVLEERIGDDHLVLRVRSRNGG